MAVTLLLRQSRPCQNTTLTNLLRQTNIHVFKFYSDSPDENDGKAKLNTLLSRIKSSPDNKVKKDTKLSQPKGKNLQNRKKGLKTETVNTEGIDPELILATKDIAETSKAPRQIESDLLKKLKVISEESVASKDENIVSGETSSMSSVFSDVKIEKKPVSQLKLQMDQTISHKESRMNLTLDQKQWLEERAKKRRQEKMKNLEEKYVPLDLFGATPLGVFTAETATETTDPDAKTKEYPVLRTWQRCEERELTLMSTPPPRNALEEYIEWTDDGKLWQFPIDNEQGIDYTQEKFHQHIFLEKHLQNWCPKAGPIRHFMELVCVGLSKNPYISVQYKIDTIQWFRSYFECQEINEILVHKGAWPDPSEVAPKSA